MSDALNNAPSAAPSAAPSVVETARSMGWRPLEEFRGDASKWVDAETFVNRGEHFLPILRKDRDELRKTNEQLAQDLKETKRLLEASTEAINALRDYQSKATEQAVKKARADWINNLRDARERGDVDAEIAAQSEITKIDVALAAPKEEPKPAAPAPAPAAKPAAGVDPDLQAWIADNRWYETDARKRALAHGIAEELRADPRNATLLGRAFYDKISEEVENYLGTPPGGSKVAAGGRPSGAGTSRRKMGYDDLPSDAKAACDKFARSLVGPGRAYKDEAAWQAKYVADYFSE